MSKVKFTVRLSEEEHARLRQVAHDRYCSMDSLIKKAIAALLNRLAPKPKDTA